MKYPTKFLTSALTLALVAAYAPSAYATADHAMSLRASERGCNRVPEQLERERCLYNSRRTTSRYRYRRTQSEAVRNRTLRELRDVSKNRPVDNIRWRGSDLVNRDHMRSGGRSRRTIRRNFDGVRNMCRTMRGTERYNCIRKRWRHSGEDLSQ